MKKVVAVEPKKQQPGQQNARITLFVVIFSLAAGIIVHFSDNLHYNSLILSAQNQATTAQNTMSSEQYDIQFLINDTNQQINCYDLHSNYVRSLCNVHNKTHNGL